MWDCVYKENVLAVPWFLAFQGDNPMASEFASHIGMGGKFFCRVCHARGADEKTRPPGAAGEIDRLKDFMTVSVASKYLIGSDYTSLRQEDRGQRTKHSQI